MEFNDHIPHFLRQYLSKPAYTLPKSSLWVVDFQNLNEVKEAISNTARIELGKWNIDKGLDLLVKKTSNTASGYRGCMFCHSVSIPGESTVVNPEGIQKNHFLASATGDGRGYYNPTGLRMTFLETNVSFVDNLIRPWVVTTARLGMIARPKTDKAKQYRQTTCVYKLGVVNKNKPPFILQKYTFYGTCPIEVQAEEYNYNPQTSPIIRDVTFTFHNYQLHIPNNPAISNKEN
jgi:hypothetical protein